MGEWEKHSLLMCLSSKANTAHPKAPLPRKAMATLCCWEAEIKYSCLGFLFVSTCDLWFLSSKCFCLNWCSFNFAFSPCSTKEQEGEYGLVSTQQPAMVRCYLMVPLLFLNIIISFCLQVPLLWETLNNCYSFTCSSLITELLSSQILGLCGQFFLASRELHLFSCWKIYCLIPVNPKPGHLFSKSSSLLKASGF